MRIAHFFFLSACGCTAFSNGIENGQMGNSIHSFILFIYSNVWFAAIYQNENDQIRPVEELYALRRQTTLNAHIMLTDAERTVIYGIRHTLAHMTTRKKKHKKIFICSGHLVDDVNSVQCICRQEKNNVHNQWWGWHHFFFRFHFQICARQYLIWANMCQFGSWYIWKIEIVVKLFPKKRLHVLS